MAFRRPSSQNTMIISKTWMAHIDAAASQA
jgi:hypothetical protein